MNIPKAMPPINADNNTVNLLNFNFQGKKAVHKEAEGPAEKVSKDSGDKSGQDIDSSELIAHLKKGVVRVELWECAVKDLDAGLQANGTAQQGVVVTMDDGRRYLVQLLPSGPVVAYAGAVGKFWKMLKTRDVQGPKLEDYLDKCGDQFNAKTNNSLDAAERMYNLG